MKNCLNCKYSYCEDLFGELCCKIKKGKICPHKWIEKGAFYSLKYYTCKNYEEDKIYETDIHRRLK